MVEINMKQTNTKLLAFPFLSPFLRKFWLHPTLDFDGSVF